MRLRKLSEQTIVLTGATSGIGLVTARMAAERGARLVLVARSNQALEQLTSEIRMKGGQAEFVVADVAQEDELRRASEVAIERFGGFDTWINDAGVLIYGRNEDVSREDQRRLFETNFWGVVNGSLIAVEQLKQRGGALINVGSEMCDHSAPMQGMYAASKHAVKGFTDSLRMELEHEKAQVSVTLIKPAAIDTPIVGNAKNYMEQEADLPPPIYAPELVAKAILFAAENPKRDLYVGGSAKLNAAGSHYLPRLADVFSERFAIKLLQKNQPRRQGADDNLYEPRGRLRERQGRDGVVFESSLYTVAAMYTKTAMVVFGAIGLVALAAIYRNELRSHAPALRRHVASMRSLQRRPRMPSIAGMTR